MPDPRLSVIVPFYDEVAFLQMALRSIAAQGLSDTQIIVVNDNPDRYGDADIRALGLPAGTVLLHHPQNLGLSAARNTGMAQASGSWIGFLDADDYYLADGLAAQLDLAQQTRADITHAACCISHVGAPDLRPHLRDATLFPKPHQGAGLKGFEAAQFITSSWSSLYQRAFLDRHGLRFDPEQRKFEDRLFVLQTVTAARSIATLGRPARVWRRRAGSISVTPPDAAIHRLQVQLLEKCMAHMRAYAAIPGTAHRFLRREVFNTVSRLIWDMDLIPALAAGMPEIDDLGPRVRSLLGDDQFGHAIFDDPLIAQISRVGAKSRNGLIRRVDFFDLHKSLRAGDFDGAATVLHQRKAAAAPTGLARAPAIVRPPKAARLVLHLGMHKTGSTWLQRLLLSNATLLRRAGVLFPETGLSSPDFVAVREGGFPGHLGLLTALRRNDDSVWSDLDAEIRAARCGTVILSCENLLLPLEPERDALLDQLFSRLSGFGSVSVVAFARRPDVWAEMFYRELVCNGHRPGARSLDEFLVDYADRLTNLPGLFAPFDTFAAAPVTLLDHDTAAETRGHWSAFRTAAGLTTVLPEILPVQPAPLYPTPGRDEVLAARLICTMISQADMRQSVMRAFFAGADPADRGPALLSPGQRLSLLDRYEAQSATYAAARGYAPDLQALRQSLLAEHWHPATSLPAALIDRLHQARLQAERPVLPNRGPAEPQTGPKTTDLARSAGEITLRIRARPWVRRLLGR